MMTRLRPALKGVLTALCLLAAAGARGAPIKVACCGDSITVGTGVANPSVDSWPAKLGAMLGESYDVCNFGVGAATLMRSGDMPYWGSGGFTQASNSWPDVVLVLLGSNDGKSINWTTQDEFILDYKEFIAHFEGLESSPRVWICTPPPVWGTGDYGILPSYVNDEIVPAVEQVASETGTPLVDLYTLLGGYPEYFTDNVHPNEEGTAVIAAAIRDALTAYFMVEIAASGGGREIACGSTSPSTANYTDFRTVDVGEEPLEHTFTIASTGTLDLNLTGSPAVAISGQHAADFTVMLQPVSPVPASGSTTFTIAFAPKATGLRTSTVTIATDDDDRNPFVFAIQGYGVGDVPPVSTSGEGGLCSRPGRVGTAKGAWWLPALALALFLRRRPSPARS